MDNELDSIDDTSGELLDLNAPNDGKPGAPEDRGDSFTPKPELDADADEGKGADKDAAADADLPAEDKPATGHIPKARFNEVISQREALKEQLAEANRQLAAAAAQPKTPAAVVPPVTQTPAAPAPELKALRAQYRDALMEGDMDKAASLDDLIDEEVMKIAETRITQRQAAQQGHAALQAASAQAVIDFPYLDTEEGAEALELIVMSRDRKMASGIAPAQALREAVQAIAPRFAPVDGAAPDKGLITPPKPADTRSANALTRGAADSNLQPASIQAGVGNRATAGRVNVEHLTEEQFENLPTAEKKRLRGD